MPALYVRGTDGKTRTVTLYTSRSSASIDGGSCLTVRGHDGVVYYAATVDPKMVTNQDRIYIRVRDSAGNVRAVLDNNIKRTYNTGYGWNNTFTLYAPFGFRLECYSSNGSNGSGGSWGTYSSWIHHYQSYRPYSAVYYYSSYTGSGGYGGSTGTAAIAYINGVPYTAPAGGGGGGGGGGGWSKPVSNSSNSPSGQGYPGSGGSGSIGRYGIWYFDAGTYSCSFSKSGPAGGGSNSGANGGSGGNGSVPRMSGSGGGGGAYGGYGGSGSSASYSGNVSTAGYNNGSFLGSIIYYDVL